MVLVGQGIDQHQLNVKTNNTIVLGGIKIPSKYSIVAHSDGDVVLHSISNALLGISCKGDIGDYFSDKDKNTKNIDSKKILKFCLKTIKGKINNVDLTIQCENIMIGKYKKQIGNSLKKLLGCSRVNVKATRYEHSCNLICCYSVVSVDTKGK